MAQTLDYVSAMGGWSYADFQRQVAAAVGRQGNIPFDAVQKNAVGTLREQEFVDAVSRGLREGRFLVLLIDNARPQGTPKDVVAVRTRYEI